MSARLSKVVQNKYWRKVILIEEGGVKRDEHSPSVVWFHGSAGGTISGRLEAFREDGSDQKRARANRIDTSGFAWPLDESQ